MPGASNCRCRPVPPPRARCSCAGAPACPYGHAFWAAPGVASAVRPGTPGVEMGLEALGEDWSLSLLGPRDRLEAAVRPALARLAAPPDWRASGERLSSAERRRSATGLPIRHCWTPCPAYSASRWRRSTTGGGRAGTPWSCRPRCQIPDGCPTRLPASAWSLCRRGPDGIAANWPWTASRRCCCSVRCPRRRCRWRRPGACWRACTNRPSSACATSLQLGYALFCGFREVGARRGLLFAAQSPRACPERLLEHMETFLQRSAEALAQLPARRLAGCAKPRRRPAPSTG